MSSSPSRARFFMALLACFVLAAVPGCKKKREPSPATVARAAELKPKLTQLLAQVAALSARSKSAPPAGAPLPEKPWPRAILVIGEAFLEDPKKTGLPEELDLSDPMLSVCKYIVDGAQIQDEDIQNMETCLHYEYAAVIRQVSFTPPEADEGTTYTPGRFSGEVLVFHLATGELRGRHSIDVSQSDQLELTTRSGQKPAAHEWRRQAITYLTSHVKDAARKKLQ